MTYLPIELAQRALDLNWPKKKMLDVVSFCKDMGLVVTRVEQEQLVLRDRWFVYRDQSFEALERVFGHQDDEGVVHVWGDGSGTTFDKPAGIGTVVEWPWSNERTLISENIGPGTNNRAELMAVWRGLKEVPDALFEIVVHTDSEWTIGALSKNWSITKNVELVKAIRKDLALRTHPLGDDRKIGRCVVRFEHVKGHAGIEQNELCDKLARAGRLQSSL